MRPRFLPVAAAVLAASLVGTGAVATMHSAAAHAAASVGAPLRVAPYIDITRDTPTLPDVAAATGQRDFTLAFILADSSGCDPSWGGTIGLNDSRIIDEVHQLEASGGQVAVASGGAQGPYLEGACTSSSALAAAYEKALDAVGSNHLDIDVEASIPNDTVNAALAQVQADRGTSVTFTLRVQAASYGLDPYSVSVLKSAKAHGVQVTVNPMLMDFGGGGGSWGDSMVSAARATLGQMATIWPDKSTAQLDGMLAVTPMIGVNDTGPVTTLADAQQLLGFADSTGIATVKFWSVGRDNGSCPGSGARPDCSGVSQSDYAFTDLFKQFSPGSPPTSPPPTSPPPTTPPPSSPPPTGGCAPAWDAGTSYSTGDQVSYSGDDYTATYYSTGAVPGSATSWAVWHDDGPC